MANSLNIDLEGKVVIFKDGTLKPEYPEVEHPFLVNGAGFGCSPNTQGVSLSGTFLSDGEDAVFGGFQIERLATQEEIDAALAVFGVANDPESPFYGLVQSADKV